MKIGLTGGIACGKSTVSKILSEEGFRILDCDKLGHELFFTKEVKEAIRNHFGEGVFDSDGHVHRQVLGRLAFKDKSQLAFLERLVKPKVFDKVLKTLEQGQFIVVDCFDIIGTVVQPQLDEIWLVTCPQEDQVRRLMERNSFSREYALERIAAQKSQEELMPFADVIIDNSGDRSHLEQQVFAQIRRIKAIAR